MPQIVDSIRFSSAADPAAWPQISSPDANIVSVQNGDLQLDAGRKMVFPGDAPLSVSGALTVLTGGPAPKERLRVLANGNVGIGTDTPTHTLDVQGTLNASIILLNGAPLSVSQWVNASGGAIHYPGGNVGVATSAPTARLHVVAPGGFDNLVPIVAQSNSTFFGALDAGGHQRFAISLDGDGTSFPVNFYDKYDGNWHRSLSLKLGQVGIGLTAPRTPLHVLGRISSGLDFQSAGALTLFPPDGFAWFHIDNGPPGRAIGRLRLSHGPNPGDHELMCLVQNGNVGVGTPNPAFRFDVAGPVHATSFPTSSDVRLKTAVAPLTDALARLDALQPVSFEWNETYRSLGRSTDRREIGLLAHEVEAVFPELVSRWQGCDYRAVDYGRLTAVLVQAIKELIAMVQQREGVETPGALPS
jgi:hypothetical protein